MSEPLTQEQANALATVFRVVVEAARSRGCCLVLQDWRADRAAPGKWAALFDLPDGHDTGQHCADTPAEAIKLAWANAVGVLVATGQFDVAGREERTQ